MSISVSIIEDDIHYSNALKKIIEYDSGLFFVEQYFNAQEAIRGLQNRPVDIVITDINLTGATGIEIIEILKPLLLQTEFLMCTNHESDDYIFSAIMAGAVGYLRKGESMDVIIRSIKESCMGGTPMSPGIAKKTLQLFRNTVHPKIEPNEQLTKAETQILELLCEGLLYKEIAYKKNVTIDTIKKHTSNIYKKLQVKNKIEAINKLSKIKKR